jgi:quercetin dioxygenase-like cupin family protein
MKSKLIAALVVALGGLAFYVGTVLATPSAGFTGTTLAKATFGELYSHVHTVPATWDELIKTKGDSDLYVQQNTWQPGGTTGWHTHPGPSLVIVTQGTVTEYDGDDPSCTPHVYSANGTNAFVDIGGGAVHLVRNESDAIAKTIAVQLIPAGAVRRQDVPDPGNCSF